MVSENKPWNYANRMSLLNKESEESGGRNDEKRDQGTTV